MQVSVISRSPINRDNAHLPADIPTQNVVVRFSEGVDGFALPPGHTYDSLGLSEDEKK
jgi:hypothetical protein